MTEEEEIMSAREKDVGEGTGVLLEGISGGYQKEVTLRAGVGGNQSWCRGLGKV